MFRVAFKQIRRHLLAPKAIAAAATVFLAFSPLVLSSSAQANEKYAAYVIDVKSGKVLYSRHADSYRYPASLTKMMTLYMVFEQLEAGKLSLNSRLKVSKYAAGRPPTKLGLKVGGTLKVKDAILGLVTKSANDAASVIAENLGGSESKFAEMMTAKARSIGMSRTTFKNASGLPNSRQKTTAKDMALLGRALKDRFPSYYKYFSTRSFKYAGRTFGNHNKLLGRVKGVDGIKTGYTRASGFNLVTNVETRDRHIVAVVLGGRTGASRDAHMRDLIAQYLPKAKTGRRMTALVVPRGGSSRSYIQLADTIRLPLNKTLPGLMTATSVNLASSLPAVEADIPADIPASATAIKLAVLPQDNPGLSVPSNQVASASNAMSAYAPESQITTAALAIPPLPRPANDPLGDMSTHTPDLPTAAPVRQTPTGWQIQLAATPTLAAANNILSEARSKNERLLVARINHTETVEKDNTTLYRARFAGFESKAQAREACAVLKKQKFACLALNP